MRAVAIALLFVGAVACKRDPPAPPVTVEAGAQGRWSRFQPEGLPTITRWGATTGAAPHVPILLLHGAGGPDFFTEKKSLKPYPESLADAGYVVFMPHYPSVRDAEDTISWIEKQDGVAKGRLGAVGFSAGGFLVIDTASVEPRIKAAVDFYGGVHGEYASKMTRMPPTLILHGDKDEAVDIKYARDLAALFDAKHVTYEMHVYPGEEHGFREPALSDSIERMITFFRATL